MLFINLDKLSADAKTIIFITYMFAIIVFLVVYLLVLNKGNLQRYAQAVFHLHLVNHVIRDHLAALEAGKDASSLKDSLAQILDSIAACYSVLTGRCCRVSLKELTSSLEVRTVTRDSLSAASVTASDKGDFVHAISKNTDFVNLWYSRDGCSRFYHCNNLVRAWKSRQYENTSFDIYGYPEIRSWLGISMVAGWKLPYKSTMVFPIRYVHNWNKWPVPGNAAYLPEDDMPRVWGFLCIDSVSRGVFRLPYAAEVGGGFADALYVLFTYARLQISG